MNKQFQWEVIEDMQDEFPYYWLGWWGFIPFIYYPEIGGVELV